MYQWVATKERRRLGVKVKSAESRVRAAQRAAAVGGGELASTLAAEYDVVMRTGAWTVADEVLDPVYRAARAEGLEAGLPAPVSGPWAVCDNARATYLYQRVLPLNWGSERTRLSVEARDLLEPLAATEGPSAIPPRLDLANLLDDCFCTPSASVRARELYRGVIDEPMAGPNRAIALDNYVKSLKDDKRYAATVAEVDRHSGPRARALGESGLPRLASYAVLALRLSGRRRAAAERLGPLLEGPHLPSQGIEECWTGLVARMQTAHLREECEALGLDMDRAARELREAAEREGDVPWTWSMLGDYLAGVGSYEEAGRASLRGFEGTHQGLTLRWGAWYLHKAGRGEEALAAIRKDVASRGPSAAAALAARWIERPDLEWAWRQELVAADPESAHPNESLAWSAVCTPHTKEERVAALENSEAAVQLATTDPTANRDSLLHTLGRLHQECGNAADAEEAFGEGFGSIPARFELAAMQPQIEHRLALALSTFDLHPDPFRKAAESQRCRAQLVELAKALPGASGAELLGRFGIEEKQAAKV